MVLKYIEKIALLRELLLVRVPDKFALVSIQESVIPMRVIYWGKYIFLYHFPLDLKRKILLEVVGKVNALELETPSLPLILCRRLFS